MKITGMKLVAGLCFLPALALARWDAQFWTTSDCTDNGDNAGQADDVSTGCIDLTANTHSKFLSGSGEGGLVSFFQNRDCTGASCGSDNGFCCKAGEFGQWRSFKARA
ncbi:hypothetical protein N431DRAFT_111390 [Stipitochalara longipes BDJ]|nr:hypothetical protein N431DRAFT_111390 [Stipitochalara longipes BDJ]